MTWVVLIGIIVVSVIVLVATGDKQKKISDSLPSGAEVAKARATDMPLKEIKDLKAGPPQVTIYAYSSAAKLRLCPFCDGENGVEAARCHICGQPLK